jgi:hypothetical protein
LSGHGPIPSDTGQPIKNGLTAILFPGSCQIRSCMGQHGRERWLKGALHDVSSEINTAPGGGWRLLHKARLLRDRSPLWPWWYERREEHEVSTD